ncbi:MAG: hypothetical protein HKM95_14260 [Inquilinus sp.]|nr:hypothetical protein [Inquilinus sp.]
MSATGPAVVCAGIAVLDQIFATAALPARAGKHFADGFTEVGGGPAATAAVAVARLGGRARFWGRVGGDATGCRILDELAELGVDIAAARRIPDGRSSVSAVMVDAKGERMIIAFADKTLDPDTGFLPLHDLDSAQAVLVDARWPNGARAVLQAARERGLPAILDADTTPDDAARALLPLASHTAFSSGGLEQVTGSADPAEGLARAARMTEGWVAVTAGGDGCYWRDGERLAHLPAFPVAIRDTLGAGDVFHGALALALAEGQPIEAAVRFASAAAALKCTRPGGRAGIPSRAEVDTLLREAA